MKFLRGRTIVRCDTGLDDPNRQLQFILASALKSGHSSSGWYGRYSGQSKSVLLKRNFSSRFVRLLMTGRPAAKARIGSESTDGTHHLNSSGLERATNKVSRSKPGFWRGHGPNPSRPSDHSRLCSIWCQKSYRSVPPTALPPKTKHDWPISLSSASILTTRLAVLHLVRSIASATSARSPISSVISNSIRVTRHVPSMRSTSQ